MTAERNGESALPVRPSHRSTESRTPSPNPAGQAHDGADDAADDGEEVFAVDYRVCGRCRRAWVESPATAEEYQRRGLAVAALAALRAEHPDHAWYTLGGHYRSARPFWNSAGAEVDGGYRQEPLCPHLEH